MKIVRAKVCNIRFYEKVSSKQQRGNVMHAGPYISVLSVKEKVKVASLVSQSCLIDRQLKGQVTSLLVDTGYQVSIIDMEDLENYQSNTVVRSLEEILDECDSVGEHYIYPLYRLG